MNYGRSFELTMSIPFQSRTFSLHPYIKAMGLSLSFPPPMVLLLYCEDEGQTGFDQDKGGGESAVETVECCEPGIGASYTV